jgi:hypothetical protein
MLLPKLATKLTVATVVAFNALTFGTSSALAANPPSIAPTTGTIDKGFNFIDFFTNGVKSIINLVFFLAGAAAIIYLIWAGIKYITSGGDTKKAGEARTAILNAVIGIAVVIGAYTLINIAFGLNNAVSSLESTAQPFR